LDIKNEIRLISASTNCSLIDEETINKALDIHERYGYSYYDSLMVSSALQCNCDFLFSEDMRDEQQIEELTIRNIFKEL